MTSDIRWAIKMINKNMVVKYQVIEGIATKKMVVDKNMDKMFYRKRNK